MSEVPLSVVSAAEQAQNVAGDACRAARRCGLLWLAVGLVGRTLDSLSGLSEQEVNITVHERASGVLARRASPIMSKPLYSENDDVHAAGRPSECGGRIGKSLALAALPQIRRCEWLCLRGQVA
jgi:hypothetical protein